MKGKARRRLLVVLTGGKGPATGVGELSKCDGLLAYIVSIFCFLRCSQLCFAPF
ncbi:Unknown protein sequence [Pseudomonas syringae pv. syringae]|nr:Unknown protein sequence [Pseudomonas syringae pv. syringae]